MTSSPSVTSPGRHRLAALSLLVIILSSTLLAVPATAGAGRFDIEARRQELTKPQFAEARAACLALPRKKKWHNLVPLPALLSTEGYGADRSTAEVSLASMVLSARALAGDRLAEADLAALLTRWAKAGALLETARDSDPYYALKRSLLPLIVGYDIINRRMEKQDRQAVRDWLDQLVRRVDARFDGEVDRNNHRTLADLVLMLWGAVIDDKGLIESGRGGFLRVLADMRADGTLPLEARRGARALWYHRQTLASLTLIGIVDQRLGGDLFHRRRDGRSFELMLSALFNGLLSPTLVDAYAEENFKPGPQHDPRQLDLGFLVNRGNGRHYMAFAEALLGQSEPSLSIRRLAALVNRGPAAERPLIDEFIGGNATCFFWEP